eukprot:2911375-Alexandrium_andersonii.AAC.1
MSASLVGSEMCIRDRGLRHRVLHGREERGARMAALVRALPVRSRAWRACLLYTSDAADDM